MSSATLRDIQAGLSIAFLIEIVLEIPYHLYNNMYWVMLMLITAFANAIILSILYVRKKNIGK